MDENEISKLIIGAAIKVHRETGPGLLESAYEKCLCLELKKSNLRIENQKIIDLIYNGENLGSSYKADIIVEDRVLIEIKSVEQIASVHVAQTYTYLKILNLKLGILINFNTAMLKDGIKRVVDKID